MLCCKVIQAQVPDTDSIEKVMRYIADTTYIDEVEDRKGTSDKVLHAEPLFIDLIRDLGARKGEAEWNVACGMTDMVNYTRYDALIEYEFAPVNRLGVEIELPVSFHKNHPDVTGADLPENRINSLKLAAQYSFYVSEKNKLSSAAGYIHEFELHGFRSMAAHSVYRGNLYNPFIVVAKRWGNNLHTMLYTGPRIRQHFRYHNFIELAANFSIHYMLPGTRNFAGIEVNQTSLTGQSLTVIRPQMRLGVTDNILLGIVTGVPLQFRQERLSTFLRLIYEPGHRH